MGPEDPDGTQEHSTATRWDPDDLQVADLSVWDSRQGGGYCGWGAGGELRRGRKKGDWEAGISRGGTWTVNSARWDPLVGVLCVIQGHLTENVKSQHGQVRECPGMRHLCGAEAKSETLRAVPQAGPGYIFGEKGRIAPSDHQL